MITTTIILAAVFAQPDADKIRIDIESHVFGTRYRTTVTQNVLAKTPRWEKDQDHPPLSPRKAIAMADAIKSRLARDIKGTAWGLESTSLVLLDDGQCYWRVQYNVFSTLGAMIAPHQLSIVVLMNGLAIDPKVSKPGTGD